MQTLWDYRGWFIVMTLVLVWGSDQLMADPGYIQQPAITSGFGPVVADSCFADNVYLEFGDACDPATDSGIRWDTTGFELDVAGSTMLRTTATAVVFNSALVATAVNGPRIIDENVTDGNPTLLPFGSDFDSGVCAQGADNPGMCAGGITMVFYTEDTDDVVRLQVGLSMEPSGDQALAADGVLACNSNAIARIAGSGGAVTLSAAPSINDGAHDGQFCIIQGTSDVNTVTINDNTNVQLAGGVAFTMGQGDTLQVVWDSGDSDWYEVSRSNN